MPNPPGPWPVTPSPETALDDALAFVVDASRQLNAPLGYEATVRVATRAPIGGFADIAALFLRQGDDGGAPRIEAAHREPGRESAAQAILADQSDRLAALATLRRRRDSRTVLWQPLLDERALRRLDADDPDTRRMVRSLDLHSLIVLPLTARGHKLGVIGFGRLSGSPPFGAAHFAAARVFSQRVASALEAARLSRQAEEEDARRVEAEEAVRRWAHAFHSAGWGAALADIDGRLEVVNAEFARIHGYESPEAMRGVRRAELEAEPDAQGGESDAIDDGTPHESRHRRADGCEIPVLATITPMRDAGGAVIQYAISVQDLSEMKRTEHRLHHAQQMEAVGRLAGGVAHEVNNMMTIVLGFGDLVLNAQDISEEHRQDVTEMCTAAFRAARITQQLLAYSRQQLLHLAVVDFSEAVAESARALRALLPADVRLETRFATRVGAGVRVDRTQLEQMVLNLAMNARDAMRDGGTLTLATDYAYISSDFGPRYLGIPIPAGRYAMLSVADTGHGMDAETRARIFEPFFTTKDVGHGTGLGLATVYGVVKQSDGYIWVDSTPGDGTVFTICLPEVPLDESTKLEPKVASPTDAPRPSEANHRGSGAGATVLLVEDEPTVRSLVRRLLGMQGCQVLEASTGTEALKVVEELKTDLELVLTDVVMPEVGGRLLVERLRQRFPDLPVIYMSGYARDDMLRRGELEPGALFLKKPFTAGQLLEHVTAALAWAHR